MKDTLRQMQQCLGTFTQSLRQLEVSKTKILDDLRTVGRVFGIPLSNGSSVEPVDVGLQVTTDGNNNGRLKVLEVVDDINSEKLTSKIEYHELKLVNSVVLKAKKNIMELNLPKEVVNGEELQLIEDSQLKLKKVVELKSMKVARKVFDEIPESGIVAGNAMNSVAFRGLREETVELFVKIPERGVEANAVGFSKIAKQVDDGVNALHHSLIFRQGLYQYDPGITNFLKDAHMFHGDVDAEHHTRLKEQQLLYRLANKLAEGPSKEHTQKWVEQNVVTALIILKPRARSVKEVPQVVEEVDKQGLEVNKLSSTNRAYLSYDHYFLKYCKPKKIVNNAENLGKDLRGDRIGNSVYEYEMREDPESDSARIDGFEITPNGNNHEYKERGENPQTTTCNKDTKNLVQGTTVPQEVDKNKEIVITYDITFKECDIKWASWWDTYLLMNDDQIHGASFINSPKIVLFLSGTVVMIMMKTLYKNIASHNHLETQDKAQEDFGWKLVHGDNGNLVFIATEWLTTLLSMYLKAYYRDNGLMQYKRYLLVFHNIAHQGRGHVSNFFYMDMLGHYLVPFRLFDLVGGEHLNTLATGFKMVDHEVTLSHGYFRELKSTERDCDRNYIINEVDWKLRGIVNRIVLKNLATRFLNEFQISEARAFYGFQIAMENIHSEMYNLLLEAYIKDSKEKHRLVNAIESIPCVASKAKWVVDWINNSNSFAERFVVFSCVERIYFSGNFCATLWLKQRGLMPNLMFTNKLIFLASRKQIVTVLWFSLVVDSSLRTRMF